MDFEVSEPKSHVFTAPECVVGQKKARDRKVPSDAPDCSAVQLDHLEGAAEGSGEVGGSGGRVANSNRGVTFKSKKTRRNVRVRRNEE